jgi:uncharacterized membrane protein YgcG
VFAAVWLATLAAAGSAAAASAAGPPYPQPVTGLRVYDNAGIFSLHARTQAQQVILAIEDRTGAQIAVYTQIKPQSDTLDKANADALALMNQWGVGRKGFDDGLVILFDMQDNLAHGQVSLYAGSGFRAAYLTDSDRQAIFDNDMAPLLGSADFDGALAIALRDIDTAATVEHRDSLNRARQINAVVGFGGLLIDLGLLAFALFWWFRRGRDPVYLDDASIYLPAAPEGLTPAMATLLMDDRCSSRTVSAGMVDLAAHGVIAFHDESDSSGPKAGIQISGPAGSGAGAPEVNLVRAIRSAVNIDGYLAADSLPDLMGGTYRFKSDLEVDAAARGWLTGRPTLVILKWVSFGVLELIGGGLLIILTLATGASGGLLAGIPLLVVGSATLGLAYFMPARTKAGAMLYAMLAAYRRTLQAAISRADSIVDVVNGKALPWATTPDAVMAWGVAFGLDSELEFLLTRGLRSDPARPRSAWYPRWWVGPGGVSAGAPAPVGGSGGLFSPSPVPDIGGMVAAIQTLGTSTSPRAGGGSGGSGSFGGGSGSGGGGAGGGF